MHGNGKAAQLSPLARSYVVQGFGPPLRRKVMVGGGPQAVGHPAQANTEQPSDNGWPASLPAMRRGRR